MNEKISNQRARRYCLSSSTCRNVKGTGSRCPAGPTHAQWVDHLPVVRPHAHDAEGDAKGDAEGDAGHTPPSMAQREGNPVPLPSRSVHTKQIHLKVVSEKSSSLLSWQPKLKETLPSARSRLETVVVSLRVKNFFAPRNGQTKYRGNG